MAIICRGHKLLFIMVPGTGCSVVGRILQENLDGEWLPTPVNLRKGQIAGNHKHNTLPEVLNNGFMSASEREKYLVFATVRNPFSRWVTYYQRYAGEWIDDYFAFKKRQLDRERQRLDLSEEEYERRVQHIRRKQRIKEWRKNMIRTVGFNMWMKITLLRQYVSGMRENSGSPLETYAFPMLQGVDVVIRQEHLEEGLNRVLHAAGVYDRIVLPQKNATPGKKPYPNYYSYTTRRFAEYLLGDITARFGYRFNGTTDDRAVHWLSNQKKQVNT